jgi:hypothetical protein
MMVAAGNKSGGGRLTRLHAFAEWRTNARRTGELEVASPPRWFTTRVDLAMPRNTIARPRGQRKTYTKQIPTSATYRALCHEWKPTPLRVGSACRGSQRAPPSLPLRPSQRR